MNLQMKIPAAPTIAILNSNEDLMEAISFTLEKEGFQTIRTRVPELRRGKEDLIMLFKNHDPIVVIYDLPPPYEENWNFFLLLRNLNVSHGRHFILTTTNKAAIKQLIGKIEAIEVYGKPYDLQEITQAVKLAISLGPKIVQEKTDPEITPPLITDLRDKS